MFILYDPNTGLIKKTCSQDIFRDSNGLVCAHIPNAGRIDTRKMKYDANLGQLVERDDANDIANRQKINHLKRLRNSLLDASDWTQLADNNLSAETRQAWADYRSQLRDLPQQWPSTLPDDFQVTWPTKPNIGG